MDRLYQIYFNLPSFSRLGLFGKGLNKLQFIVFWWLINSLKKTIIRESFGTKERAEEIEASDVIVSLTSIPSRLNNIVWTLETLFRQSVKPRRIILWLDIQQEKADLPPNLKSFKERGLEIYFVKDLGPHTKYYYALKKFPEYKVVTVDDDVFYPVNTIDNLIRLSKRYPSAICANRVHKIITDRQGKLKPYRKWVHNFNGPFREGDRLLLTGVGGVLYPPHCFNDEVFNEEIFGKYCRFADDIWLTVQAIRSSRVIVSNSSFNKDFLTIKNRQTTRLVVGNSLGGGNDDQFKQLVSHYSIDLV